LARRGVTQGFFSAPSFPELAAGYLFGSASLIAPDLVIGRDESTRMKNVSTIPHKLRVKLCSAV
jgi:hypothetical protein